MYIWESRLADSAHQGQASWIGEIVGTAITGKKCKQRPGGFSTPTPEGKIICRYCEQEIQAGSKICPLCGKTRMLFKTELRFCGMKIHGEWADEDIRQNKSEGRGGRGLAPSAMFCIDSGDYAERVAEGDE